MRQLHGVTMREEKRIASSRGQRRHWQARGRNACELGCHAEVERPHPSCKRRSIECGLGERSYVRARERVIVPRIGRVRGAGRLWKGVAPAGPTRTLANA